MVLLPVIMIQIWHITQNIIDSKNKHTKQIMNKQRQHRRVWTNQEDQTLKMYVEQWQDISKPKWKQISQSLNIALNLQFKRNPKQCRERWYNSLAPTSQQTKQWSTEDDVTLIQACKKYGHRWSRLTKQFDQNMNDNRLKNHFYSTVRKVVRVINNIVKESKKQFQKNMKNSSVQIYSNQQIAIMKQISKLRTFEPKLLSKVFSLIDQKQQYRYQAKQSLSVQEVKAINDQILNFMEDYVTGQNGFTTQRILRMIAKVMHVNRTIKTKYVREVKLSIQDEVQIQKQQQSRKKRQKKINNIVKEQLDNKIIPDRKTKIEIINKIRDENKKLKKLIKTVDKRRIKRKKIVKEGHASGEIRENSFQQQQNQLKQQQNISFEFGNKISSKNGKTNQHKNINELQQNQHQNRIDCEVNINFSYDLDPNFNKVNSNSQIAQKQKSNFSPRQINSSQMINFNQNGHLNQLSNISFTYQKNQNQQKYKIQQQEKIPNQIQINVKKDSNQDLCVRDNPFSSNFLNNIPLASSNNKKEKFNQGFQFKQLVNPFFPQHKLSHSQGYFTFQQPNNQRNQQVDQDMYRSNPIINSINFIDAPNQQNTPENNQAASSKALKNSKIFQGLFASYNYSNSNNDKASEQSQRMKSSLIDLIPNFHPLHTSAFNPILLGNLKEQQNERRENQRFMEASRPFSVQLDQNFATRKFGLDQSQPIQLFRSSDQRNQMIQGPNLSFSYSYGQLSQRSKSNRSRRNK